MQNYLTKILFFLAAIAAFSSMGYIVAAEARFPDIAAHWARECVETMAEKGMIAGMNDGLFHPDDTVTTAQFVTMLLRSGVGELPPTDGHWASGYLDEALRRNIIEADDIRRRDAPLIRQFAARIGLEALRSIFDEPDATDISAADRLKDLYQCSACVWSTGQLYVKGIMLGRPDGLFHGNDTLTRAEAAVIIMKIADPSMRTPEQTEFPASGRIAVDTAVELMASHRNTVLIDVRSREEHSTGFISGSVCIPLPEITADITRSGLPEDKNAVIIVYCRDGSLSRTACAFLTDIGYVHAYDLGGIADWPYDIYSTD